MSRFVDEPRHAFRALIASPTFSLASVLTLTIGIGAIAAIFTVYDAVLLKPLPFAHADRLVRVTRTQAPVETGTLSPPIFRNGAIAAPRRSMRSAAITPKRATSSATATRST